MIHVIATITAKPGMRLQILEAFRANMPAVHAEKGCIEYQPAVDAEDAGGIQTGTGARHIRCDRKMGVAGGANGTPGLAAHGGLWSEDPGHDRKPGHSCAEPSGVVAASPGGSLSR